MAFALLNGLLNPIEFLSVAAWHAVGLAGLFGFWWWVIQSRHQSKRGLFAMICLIAAGTVAIFHLATGGVVILGWLGVAGGMFAMVEALLSNYPFERVKNQND